MIHYKELCDYTNYAKISKINVGDKVLIPIDGKDINFIVLNKPKEYKINLMSSIPIIKDTRWKDNHHHSRNFKSVKFLHFKDSDLNKKLQSYYELLPKDITDRIIDYKSKELYNIDLFNDEVSFDSPYLDKLWIPSISQVYGDSGFSNDDVLEQQLEYFAKPENRILHDENGKNVEWWLRSVNIQKNNIFYITKTGALANCEPVFKRCAPICFTILCK